MDRRLANKVVELAEEMGIDAKIAENYSGRGMYGSKTTGVTIPRSVPQACIIVGFALAKLATEGISGGDTPDEDCEDEVMHSSDYEDIERFTPRTDSMGRDDIILY